MAGLVLPKELKESACRGRSQGHDKEVHKNGVFDTKALVQSPDSSTETWNSHLPTHIDFPRLGLGSVRQLSSSLLRDAFQKKVRPESHGLEQDIINDMKFVTYIYLYTYTYIYTERMTQTLM